MTGFIIGLTWFFVGMVYSVIGQIIWLGIMVSGGGATGKSTGVTTLKWYVFWPYYVLLELWTILKNAVTR